MENVSLLDENWQIVLSLLPTNWQSLAKETGSITRQLRSFESEDAILRTLLLHIAKGYSLRETVVKAKAAGIADVSDVALLKRLKASELWLKQLCESLLKERNLYTCVDKKQGITLRLVDGTNVKEPGKTGSLWRVHYSLQLPDLSCDYFKLTPTQGTNTAETYHQFPVNKNDCIIGDRGYSTAPGIEYVTQAGGFVLVRVNTGALPLFTSTGKAINLLAKVKTLTHTLSVKQWIACVKQADGRLIKGRLCVLRKSEHAIERAIKMAKRKAEKSGKQPRPETLEYAKYVIVFTTLPKETYDAQSILEWYRIRWQIECLFKRLKSLVGLGHLPKYDEKSSRAWLYGKLLVGLLVEKLIARTNDFSPWGYCLGKG